MVLQNSLTQAIAQLQNNFDLQSSYFAHAHPELVPTFRTATIKSFEYAYELAVRLMRRQLTSMLASSDELNQADFRTVMRLAAENGLIDDPQAWFLFREKAEHHLPFL